MDAPGKNILSTNKYYTLMENGEFDTDHFEEEGAFGLDPQPQEGNDCVLVE